MKNMTAMNAKRKQAGFTIIELVVVILLLGILTATALPRFMDVTDEAHQAVVDATAGGLRTGAALFKAQWVAEGQPTTAVAEFGSLFANANGYPIGLNAATDADDMVVGACASLYNLLLQEGRPTVASATQAVEGTTDTDDIETGIAAGVDFVAILDQDATDINDSAACEFYYVGQYSTPVANGETLAIQMLTYTFETGAITAGTYNFDAES